MRKLTIFLIFFFSFPLSAEIYKFVDENGNVVFTDHPTEGAEKLEERKIPAISSPESRKLKLTPKADNTVSTGYEKFEVNSPKNDETIWDNNGVINVDLAIEPGLQSGHTVELLLDGKVVGKPEPASTFSLVGIDRGEHTISANIKDNSGNKIATTSSVVVHLKQYSSLNNRQNNSNQLSGSNRPAAANP